MRKEQEIILHRDPRRLTGFDRDFDPFLGFDRLVRAVAPFASLGDAARELVDDHDLAVENDILPIANEVPRRP